eukprot:365399-Chlamydomonas_euryale.AAC.9
MCGGEWLRRCGEGTCLSCPGSGGLQQGELPAGGTARGSKVWGRGVGGIVHPQAGPAGGADSPAVSWRERRRWQTWAGRPRGGGWGTGKEGAGMVHARVGCEVYCSGHTLASVCEGMVHAGLRGGGMARAGVRGKVYVSGHNWADMSEVLACGDVARAERQRWRCLTGRTW